MKNKKKQIIITLIAMISLIVITVGVTYAFFNYSRTGTTDNVVKTGGITFLYTEVSGVGKGISLTEAYPVSDSIGKVQVGEGKVFDFKVTSNIEMNSNIGYQVTARKKTGSTLANSAVKVYLTEVNGTEQELLLSKYSELDQTDKVDSSKYDERILYEATVPANTSNYEKNFKLRMWVSDDTDFSDGSMNDKTFTLTVNVYADGKVVTVPANTVYAFNYTGNEQTFVIPATGEYRLETWGAQGGCSLMGGTKTCGNLGYGGYSSGIITLYKGNVLYINVGGKGTDGVLKSDSPGGYNGGGYGTWDNSDDESSGGGGGATHIATSSGLLSTFENNIKDLLIVSGGGGGKSFTYTPGSGGGFKGGVTSVTNQSEVSQTSGYAFGQGQNASGTADSDGVGGGGGGFYGGYMNNVSRKSSGSGGSGYIGNALLENKKMYCYNCEESNENSTKTISTTNVSEEATSNYAKMGNGYVKITYLGNLLKSITVSECTLDPIFDSDTTEYSCIVPNDVVSVNVNATATSTKSKVRGLGTKDLVEGKNTLPIRVIAEDGSEKIYNINITRKGEGKELKSEIMKNTVITANPTLTTSSNNTSDKSGLYKSTATNTGEATYYFRGNVTNNYVKFAGQIWRIVRINEDGTIRIIMQDGIDNNTKYVFNSSYSNYTYMYYTNSNAKNQLNSWYQTNIGSKSNLASSVATGDYYCEQTKAKHTDRATSGSATMTLYSSYTPNFKCSTDGNGKGIVSASIGLLSYDELVYAGGYYSQNNSNYYLYNSAITWWTMSPAGSSGSYSRVWRVYTTGLIDHPSVHDTFCLRPVLNLTANIQILSGDGTKDNPFVVE